MAERVVDLFEMVEIDEQKGQVTIRGPLGKEPLESGAKRAPISEACQLVGDRLAIAIRRDAPQGAHR